MIRIFFIFVLLILIAIVVTMLIFMIRGKGNYARLNGIFVMNTNIILLVMTVGFIDGRVDMYIDIAFSYAILGFVTTVILAKYIGGHK